MCILPRQWSQQVQGQRGGVAGVPLLQLPAVGMRSQALVEKEVTNPRRSRMMVEAYDQRAGQDEQQAGGPNHLRCFRCQKSQDRDGASEDRD
jgi:hypothetical protein